MPKLVIEVSGAELPDLLRLPDIVRLLDAGRVSVLPDEVPKREESSTRQKGREFFERRVREHGLGLSKFSDPGVIDFMVQGSSGVRPVRLICSENPRISLRKEWVEEAGLICAFIWLLPSRSRVFLMTCNEVKAVLGDRATRSPSFADNGYYTTVCTPSKQQLMERFEDHWDVFSS
jgi:hypothetical protein